MSCCGGSKSKTDKWSTFPDAAFNGNVEKMRELLKKDGGKDPRAFIDKTDISGYAAIHRAAQKGDCEAIRFLIESKATMTVLTNQGESAIHIACFHRKYDAVAELVKTAAVSQINTPEKKHGLTPLHIAVYRGAKDIAYLLRQNGADPQAIDKHGNTAIDMASFWAEQEAAGMSSPHAHHQETLDVLLKAN